MGSRVSASRIEGTCARTRLWIRGSNHRGAWAREPGILDRTLVGPLGRLVCPPRLGIDTKAPRLVSGRDGIASALSTRRCSGRVLRPAAERQIVRRRQERERMADATLESLRRCLQSAIDELEAWNRATPLGEAPDFQPACRTVLLRAANATSVEDMEVELGSLTRMIVESGPLSGDFLPSLRTATDALEKRRRHRASSSEGRR